MGLISQLWELANLSLHRTKLPKYGRSHRLAGADQESQPWALITGASDGLGVGWAKELAIDGINIILHGRNPTKLDALKSTIEAEYKVCVRTLVLDAEKLPTSTEEGAYKDFDRLILDTVAGIPLTILVNNIGFLGKWDTHISRDPLWIDGQISLNVRFTTHLLRVLLPILTENKPGLILSVSSAAETVPTPYSATYAGAKGWGSAFHRSLKYEMEYEKTDIEVLSLLYGFLATPSTGRTDADATWLIPTARDAARAGLNTIGCGYYSVFPWWGHSIQFGAVDTMPSDMRDNTIAKLTYAQKLKMDEVAKQDKINGSSTTS